MPRRSILSAAERESLLALPDTRDELIRHHTFSETDLSIIRQRRGPANRLGFAVQLCYLRFSGVILGVDEPPFPPLLKLVANQIKVSVESWDEYGQREQIRREHLVELQTVFGVQPLTMSHYRQAVQLLTELAMQTDKGIVLASALVEHLRRQAVILRPQRPQRRRTGEAHLFAGVVSRILAQPVEALPQTSLPVRRQARGVGQLDQVLQRRPALAAQGVKATQADRAGIARDPPQGIAGAEPAGLEHAEIPARQALALDVGGNALAAVTGIDLPAGCARLVELDHCGTEGEDIADSDVVIGDAFSGEVLAQRPSGEPRGDVWKGRRETAVVFERQLVHGLFRAAVDATIGLRVGGQTLRPDPDAITHGKLEHAGRPAVARHRLDLAGKDQRDTFHGQKPLVSAYKPR